MKMKQTMVNLRGVPAREKPGGLFRGFCRRQDLNRSHHSPIFVLENVAMVGESTDDIGIAEIQSQFNAWIFRILAIPETDADGIAKIGFVYSIAVTFQNDEVALMYVEGMQLLAAVFDRPILYITLVDTDVGCGGRWIIGRRNLAFLGNEKNRRSV